MRQELIRIETGSKATVGTGGTAWTPSSSITRWAEVVPITAAQQDRYQSIDKVIKFQFQFRGTPTITMQGTRFMWISDGHPNKLKMYLPAVPAENGDGVGRYTTVLVTDTEQVAES